jgi:hypothetical protein
MKVCIVGNSHVAALMSGLAAAPSLGGFEFDFYAIPGGHEPQLVVKGGRLRPRTADVLPQTTIAGSASGGLDLAPYEAVVVSACGLFAARNENVVPDPLAHPLGAVCREDWLEAAGAPWPVGTQFVSAAVFDAVVESYVKRHASVTAASLLSECFAGRVVLQPWPAPNRALQDNASWFVNVGYRNGGRRAWRDFMRAQYRALEKIAAGLGSAFTLLSYPLAGPLNDGFMNAEMCEADPWHANAAYGVLVLAQIRKELEQERALHSTAPSGPTPCAP